MRGLGMRGGRLRGGGLRGRGRGVAEQRFQRRGSDVVEEFQRQAACDGGARIGGLDALVAPIEVGMVGERQAPADIGQATARPEGGMAEGEVGGDDEGAGGVRDEGEVDEILLLYS